MTQEFIDHALTTLVTSSTATLIVLPLVAYFGKVWITHLMEKERLKHSLQLEQLSSELRRNSDEKLASVTHELEILKNTHLREHSDKLIIYRTTIELVATMLAKLELIVLNKRQPLDASELEAFGTERLRIYGYLGMLAPQEVMDANDRLTDLLLSVVHGDTRTDWFTIRELALALINAMRRDIGLNKTSVQYNGER